MSVGPDITRFMKMARVRLPGATDDVLQLELFSVMDDFFKGSNTWQEDIQLTIPANDPAGTVYYLTPSSPSTIDKLMWAYTLSTATSAARNSQVAVNMQTPGNITLNSQPSSVMYILVTVALTVQDPTTRDGYVTFPAWVLAKYRNVILDGLFGKMMSQPNKPFTNTQLSVFHMRKFISGISAARIDVTRNNTYRQQAWRFPGGFTRGSQKGSGGLLPPQ